MPLMATLTKRRHTADCLGGRLPRDASFRAHRGAVIGSVQRAAPDKLQARPANDGRRHRRRKSLRDGAPVRPQKRVMENVVILKRGEKIAPETETAGAPTVVAAPAAAAAEKVERVAAVDRCGAPAKAETVAAAAGQCGDPAVAAKELCNSPLEKTEKAPPAVKTETETETETEVAERCSAPAMKAEVVTAAVPCGTQAKMVQPAPTSYSSASFVSSPDPRELPIPMLVLKPRRGRAAACA